MNCLPRFVLPRKERHAKNIVTDSFSSVLPAVLHLQQDGLVLVLSCDGRQLGAIRIGLWFDQLADALGVQVIEPSRSARDDGYGSVIILRDSQTTQEQYTQRLSALTRITFAEGNGSNG